MPRTMQFVPKMIHALLLCLLVIMPVSCWAENLKVLVLLSDNSTPYLSFANALNKNLPALIQRTVIEHPEQLSAHVSADLIVAVGMKATEFALAAQAGIPVLAVMVPRKGYEELLAKAPQKITHPIAAIYLDQPWRRRIDFWHAVLPDRHKVGLLHSADTHIDTTRLRQLFAQYGGALIDEPVHSADELFSKLEGVLASSDVLLAVPDNLIYSSSNIRNILLTSYRHGVPLIGLSEAYVHAGALTAIFSTPEQLAEQAEPAIMLFAEIRQLPDSQYPRAYTIAVNKQVARSLGIAVPSVEAIRSQIERMGEER